MNWLVKMFYFCNYWSMSYWYGSASSNTIIALIQEFIYLWVYVDIWWIAELFLACVEKVGCFMCIRVVYEHGFLINLVKWKLRLVVTTGCEFYSYVLIFYLCGICISLWKSNLTEWWGMLFGNLYLSYELIMSIDWFSWRELPLCRSRILQLLIWTSKVVYGGQIEGFTHSSIHLAWMWYIVAMMFNSSLYLLNPHSYIIEILGCILCFSHPRILFLTCNTLLPTSMQLMFRWLATRLITNDSPNPAWSILFWSWLSPLDGLFIRSCKVWPRRGAY